MLLGQVGTGFTAAARDTLLRLLKPIGRTTQPVSNPLGCPIIGQPHWVRPFYVGTVEYREYRHDGLRHPSWKGLREIPPEAVWLPD